MNRFGKVSNSQISAAVESLTPRNTLKTHKCIWKQFSSFCEERKYSLREETSNEQLASILKDWAFNMKRADGTDYKEGVVKTIWNVSAKLLQKKYFEDFNRTIDPFKDITFEEARKARTAKRKELKACPENRKFSSAALTTEKIRIILKSFDENSPDGLQKKFYVIAAVELGWCDEEATSCLVEFFKDEIDKNGALTGRIEYKNTIISKPTQNSEKHIAASKWLTSNKKCQDKCPVRLLKKMLSKRTQNITTNQLFLTPNPDWKRHGIWYKNCPVAVNQLSKWTRLETESTGNNTKKVDIRNHSNRSSAVNNLTKSGANVQEVIEITGYSSDDQSAVQRSSEFPNLGSDIRSYSKKRKNETTVEGIATGIPSDIGAILATASAGTSQLKRLHLEESSTSSLEEVPRKKPRFILPLANEGVNIAKKSPVSPINITKAPVLLRIEAKLDKVLLEIEKVKSRLSSLEDKFDAHFGPQPLRKPDTYPIQSLQSFFDLEKISSKGERIAQQKYLQTLEAHDIKSFVNLAMKNSIADEVIKNHFTLHGSDSKIKLEGTEFLNMIYLAAQSFTFFEGPYWISDIFPYVAEAVRSAQMDDEHLLREHKVIIPSQDTYEGDHCKNENEEIEEHNYSTDGYDENESAFVKVELESDIDEIDEKPNLFLE